MPAAHSDDFVFFGATGDLAYKQIFRRLQVMIKHGYLDLPVIDMASSRWSDDQRRERAHDSLQKHGAVDENAYAKLPNAVSGDYGRRDVSKVAPDTGRAAAPLHYLAIAPGMFEPLMHGLVKSGCDRGAGVIVGKSFGRDVASARTLNSTALLKRNEGESHDY